MERETIINRWNQLLPVLPGVIPEDSQVWQGAEDGVSFEMVREILPGAGSSPEIMVSIAFLGGMQNLHSLVEEFKVAFGENKMAPEIKRGALKYSWLEADVQHYLDTQIADRL